MMPDTILGMIVEGWDRVAARRRAMGVDGPPSRGEILMMADAAVYHLCDGDQGRRTANLDGMAADIVETALGLAETMTREEVLEIVGEVDLDRPVLLRIPEGTADDEATAHILDAECVRYQPGMMEDPGHPLMEGFEGLVEARLYFLKGGLPKKRAAG